MSRQVASVSSLAGSLATPLTVTPSLAALLVWGGAVNSDVTSVRRRCRLNGNGQSAEAGEG